MKKCSGCKNYKAEAEYHKNKSTKSGLATECKQCESLRSKTYIKKLGPLKIKERNLRRSYGLGLVEFNEMLVACKFTCPICLIPFTYTGKTDSPVVDHDHESGVIRGVLCGRCNVGIGMLGDSLDNLDRAKRYLKEHSNV